ncbi:uracil-DNA glycosylase [Pollutimonas sp. H1-120]|uniref:uracil-DNA glycosylase n=1 Tax=Pollutimonas sp. H1-120 TaxID=3148824 RepID=UPI003B51C614
MSTAPALSTLQVAWLQEIGLDKHMLARYAADSEPFASGSAAGGVPDKTARAPAGMVSLPMRTEAAAPAKAKSAAPMVRAGDALAGRVPVRASEASAPAAAAEPVPADWEALKAHIAECRACELHAGRSQTVFGSGAASSPEWMIVGEAPGDFDDRAGLPFQGKAGALLGAMLASIGLRPDSPVFFTNLIKCRPLGNRTPRPEEIAACRPYLERQIALLKPRRILTLGRLAAQALLGSEADLDAVRGQVHRVRSETGQEIPLVATHHPASLLMRPQHKADAWRDLNLARSIVIEASEAAQTAG